MDQLELDAVRELNKTLTQMIQEFAEIQAHMENEKFDHAETENTINASFLMVMSFMVFFTQAGFTLLEVGQIRQRNTTAIILKNVGDVLVGILVYWVFGYAFAFGEGGGDANGFIGTGNFALYGIDKEKYMFYFWHSMFANTASTIVSGAVAGRCRFQAYFSYTACLTGFIYPVVSHWVWSEFGWLGSNAHLLGSNGYIDFAGSSVVHVVGGFSGTIGAMIVGQRRGYFNAKTGEPQKIWGHSMIMAALGTFILWFSFYAFIAGSSLTIYGHHATVSKITVNISLSMAMSGVGITAIKHWMGAEFDLMTTLNGILGGAVAIAGPARAVEPWAAVMIGALAGPFFIGAEKLLWHMRIDDALVVTAVHGFCGIWGTLASGIFSNADCPGYSCKGLVYGEGTQLGVQIVGLLIIISWTVFGSSIFFLLFDRISGLRVSSRDEILGLDFELGGKYEPEWFKIQEQADVFRRFDDLIGDRFDKKLGAFAEFLCADYNLENLEFILAANHFDDIVHEEELDRRQSMKLARVIFNQYIAVGCEQEVNISDSMRKEVQAMLKDAERFDIILFDRIVHALSDVLNKGSFRRFLTRFKEKEELKQAEIHRFSLERLLHMRTNKIEGRHSMYTVDSETFVVKWSDDVTLKLPHEIDIQDRELDLILAPAKHLKRTTMKQSPYDTESRAKKDKDETFAEMNRARSSSETSKDDAMLLKYTTDTDVESEIELIDIHEDNDELKQGYPDSDDDNDTNVVLSISEEDDGRDVQEGHELSEDLFRRMSSLHTPGSSSASPGSNATSPSVAFSENTEPPV